MKTYDVRVSVLLEPVGTPDVVVTCDNYRKELIVTESVWINFDYTKSQSNSRLIVEHRNRKSEDGTTAIVIRSVKLNDIESAQITYNGIYHPNDKESIRTTYIDWNGIWVLDFTVPVYTWIHQAHGLGWIYD